MSIEIVLSSVVLSAIVSGVITYMIANKKSRLQYITDERKKWRDKIRKIVENLHNASYADTLSILTELKVRLNAFGANEHSKNYSKDIHIWQIISEIEETSLNKLQLKENQEQLIEYLALLLKIDWEKSKRGIRGNKCYTLSSLYFLTSSLCFSGIIIYYYTNDLISIDKTQIVDCVSYGLLCISIMPIIQCVSTICKNMLDMYTIIKEHPALLFALNCGIWGFLDVLAVYCNIYLVSSFYQILEIESSISSTMIFLLNIIGISFLFLFQIDYTEQQFFYYKSIMAIQKKYSDSKKQHALQNQQPSCGDKTICNTKQ